MFMLRALVQSVHQFKKQQGVAAVANGIAGCAGSSRQALLKPLTVLGDVYKCVPDDDLCEETSCLCVRVCVCVQLGTAVMASLPSVNKPY